MTALAAPGSGRRARRGVLVRYLLVLTGISLVWEFAQMPLYTLGQTGTAGEIVYSALHCTVGDAMIGATALVLGLILVRPADWPREGRLPVLAASLAIGLGYTVFSEWLNVEVRGAWAYSELMPVLPGTGTGLSPLLQWVVVPVAAYLVATARRRSDGAARAPGIPRAIRDMTEIESHRSSGHGRVARNRRLI